MAIILYSVYLLFLLIVVFSGIYWFIFLCWCYWLVVCFSLLYGGLCATLLYLGGSCFICLVLPATERGMTLGFFLCVKEMLKDLLVGVCSCLCYLVVLYLYIIRRVA